MEMILCLEINAICMLVLGIVAVNIVHSVGYLKVSIPFMRSVQCAGLAILFDSLMRLCLSELWRASDGAAWFFGVLNYTAFAAAGYFWFLYCESRASGKILRDKKKLTLYFIPVIMTAVIPVVSALLFGIRIKDKIIDFYPDIIFYGEQIMVYSYIVISSIKNLIRGFKKNNFDLNDEYFINTLFGIPIVLCGVFQSLYPDIPLLPVGCMLSMLLVYIKRVKMLVMVDPLTGLSNRTQFLRIIERYKDSIKKNEKLYFLFMDIDDFKKINDTYGHTEGDRTLMLVAQALNEICRESRAFCSRYAGDEFGMIQILEENESISDIRSKIYDKLDDICMQEEIVYPIDLSIGYAEYKKDARNVHELFHYADCNMYDRKNRRKLEKN